MKRLNVSQLVDALLPVFATFAALAVGAVMLLVLGSIAAFANILSQLFDGGGRMVIMWCGGCGLALAMPLFR